MLSVSGLWPLSGRFSPISAPLSAPAQAFYGMSAHRSAPAHPKIILIFTEGVLVLGEYDVRGVIRRQRALYFERRGSQSHHCPK